MPRPSRTVKCSGGAYLVGQVLTAAYSVPALSQIQVTMGGRPAAVLYAGMTCAGLFQVNVQVPGGIPSGDQPIVLTMSGISTPARAVLPFQ